MANILENTTDAFFSVNGRWEFTYLNPVAETLLGYHRSELLGKNFWGMFPELIGTDTELNYRKVMSDQVPVEFEAVDSSGRFGWRCTLIQWRGISVFFRDVTERKRSEEERLTTGNSSRSARSPAGLRDLNNILTVISGNIGLAQTEASSDCGNLLCFEGEPAQHAAHLSASC